MLEKIEYVEKNGSALIYRCYGDGSLVELPSYLRGLPVRELADHCFAGEASFRYKKYQIKEIYRAEWEQGEMEDVKKRKDGGEVSVWKDEFPALGGKGLQEIILPPTLEGIGDYAFYGCLDLKRLYFPSGLRRLGGGAFVACNHIRQLFFAVEAGLETPYCMKDVLAELTYEVEVIWKDQNEHTAARFVYPEYYEESKENTPARIIEIIYHGTGYKFRQCFQGRSMDYHQYDALFYLASVQEFVPTVVRMAIDRLETPVELSEEARERYLAWLRKEYPAAARWLFEEKRPELFCMLGDYGYYTEQILNHFLETASGHGDAQTVSFLMDYRRSHFSVSKKRKYVL